MNVETQTTQQIMHNGIGEHTERADTTNCNKLNNTETSYVLSAEKLEANNKRKKSPNLVDKKKCHKCCQTRKPKNKNAECQTIKPIIKLCSLEQNKQPLSQLADLSTHVTLLLHDINKLKDENYAMKSSLQGINILEQDLNTNYYESFEIKMAGLLTICESIQERILCSESKERQLKDKNKLLERQVNELETNEGVLRDEVEDTHCKEFEVKKQLALAQQKIGELKDLVLDKDIVETGLMEKVTAEKFCIMGMVTL